MKIAYIVPSLINKGPVIVVHTIIKNIINKVEQVDVYYFDDDFVLEFPCSTYKLDMNVPINFDNYDIVHTHGYRPDKYVNKWRKNIKKAKTVTTIHSDIAQDFKFGYSKLFSIIFTPIWLNMMKKHDAVTVISNKLHFLYENIFKNLFRVYNGVDIDLDESCTESCYQNKINELKKRHLSVIGSYAAVNKIKGIDQVVKLLSVREDLALVFIGEGKEVEVLKKLSISLGVSERVVFFPYLKRPYNYIHLFDIYIMPSRSEGFGLALVEAALTKAAIVCSDLDVFKEIFDETQASFFKLEDIGSLNNAVTKALMTKETKGINAYKRATDFFNGKTMGDNYLEFYNEVVEKH